MELGDEKEGAALSCRRLSSLRSKFLLDVRKSVIGLQDKGETHLHCGIYGVLGLDSYRDIFCAQLGDFATKSLPPRICCSYRESGVHIGP